MTYFALPDRLAAKRASELIADDEDHFAALDACLERTVAEFEAELDATRRQPGGSGEAAFTRDQQVHRLGSRLQTLRRFGVDLCLGRMRFESGELTYVGRVGLTDCDGRRLLTDWRSPAAEPFFAATHARPMGLSGKRRYRWAGRRVVDYWDEVFGGDAPAASDDESAFIASLGASRSATMRDVLGTIAADQDAIIRAGATGALVVDGGPGTGKTVVALHRVAYLLYADPRLAAGHGGVLVVGPSRPYLDYVADVLPGLGEEGVRMCTLSDLVPGSESFPPEGDASVARLKGTSGMVAAIDRAVAIYEEPPTSTLLVETEWGDVRLTSRDWAEAFAAPEPGTAHNDAREQVWAALLRIGLDQLGADDEPPDEFDAYGLAAADPVSGQRRALAAHRELNREFGRAWPLLSPDDVVADLWSVPAYLRKCAPYLSSEEVRTLQRSDPYAWTAADVALLDAARLRLGDPDRVRRRRRAEAAAAAERARMSDVVDDLISTDSSDLGVMAMLRGQDLRAALADPAAHGEDGPDALAGPFAHVVVDEAQELTDAEWQMVLRRCPARSLTVVGDRAQAREGFAQSWPDRLAGAGFGEVRVASLSINYRTPSEVMAVAEPVIRAALPDANVPTSIRDSGVPVRFGSVAELDEVVAAWLSGNPDGIGCVIGELGFEPMARVRSLSAGQAKGLEFDLVVLVRPEAFGEGVTGAVDRYVAMTRATRQLVVLSDH